MKTTIEIDEAKLDRLMKITGIRTRRAAVDYALTEAERAARVTQELEKRWSSEAIREALAPEYDLMKLREREKPR